MKREDITLDQVRKAFAYMDYAFFSTGDYNLNIFGIRNKNLQTDTFNDYICLAYREGGNMQLKVYAATTDPGSTYRKRCIDSRGTAIMLPGQYKGAYGIGLHRNSYEALRQKKPMKYCIHRATNVKGGVSKLVQGYSAGCQVIASYDDFEELMSIARKARDKYGNSFTYTLFTEDNFMCKNKDLK